MCVLAGRCSGRRVQQWWYIRDLREADEVVIRLKISLGPQIWPTVLVRRCRALHQKMVPTGQGMLEYLMSVMSIGSTAIRPVHT